jgi:chromosome segregation ATPase
MKMIEKMVEMFTPEMTAIAIVILTVLTLFTSLMVLMTIVSLSRIKKHLLLIVEKSLELEEKNASLQHVRQMMSDSIARLTEAEYKIESIERRLDEFDKTIAENKTQFSEHASQLKEHDTLLGKAGQMMGKEAAGFNQAVKRIHGLEEEFQSLKMFQRTFEQTRNRILNALGAMPIEASSEGTRITEQKDSKETVVPSDSIIPEAGDFRKSRMSHYP